MATIAQLRELLFLAQHRPPSAARDQLVRDLRNRIADKEVGEHTDAYERALDTFQAQHVDHRRTRSGKGAHQR